MNIYIIIKIWVRVLFIMDKQQFWIEPITAKYFDHVKELVREFAKSFPYDLSFQNIEK
jgi:hypothetical protein